MKDVNRLPVVVHIGFPKAASTFLQGYFSDHDEIDFRHVKLKIFSSAPIGCEDLASAPENPNSVVRLVSNEKMAEAVFVTGEVRVWNENRFVPGAWKTVEPHIRIDPAQSAARVKSGFGADKVLMVLREQTSWLTSAYKFFQPRLPRNQRSFKDFCETPRGIVYRKVAHYDETLEAYVDVFGAENVCVLKFEDLVNNKPRLEASVCDFLAISHKPMSRTAANEGSSNTVAKLRAGFPVIDKMPVSLKRHGRTIVNALPSLNGPILDKRQMTEIKDQYARSNQRLAEIIAGTLPPEKVTDIEGGPHGQSYVTEKPQ